MGDIHINSPEIGLSRMLGDMEKFLVPGIEGIMPGISFIGKLNLYLVIVVFLTMLWYMLFVRKHSVLNKLTRPTNYYAAIVLLGIYLFLSSAYLGLGTTSVGQSIRLSLDYIVMPMAVKLFGPIVGCFFAMIQYCASFIIRGNEEFSFAFMMVAAISALIYGRLLYRQRTTYIRCFVAKLIVNLVCNLLLIPYIPLTGQEHIVATIISDQLVLQVVFAPIQALAIYASLLVLRKIRKLLAEVSWSL